MSLPPGHMLGPYEILSPIGAGGMGEVFEAKDTRLGRMVAVKVLPPTFPLTPSDVVALNGRPGLLRRSTIRTSLRSTTSTFAKATADRLEMKRT